MTRLFIHVGEDEFAADRRFIEATERLGRGEPIEPEEHIAFETWSEFFKTLTPNRIAILEHVIRHAPRSIKALAAALERDYRNVHEDVTALRRAGLLSLTPDGITTDTEWRNVSVTA